MADIFSILFTAVVYFLFAAVFFYIIAKILKYPKTDVLTAVRAAFMYEVCILLLGAMAAMLLFPLGSVMGTTSLSMIISLLFIPVHIVVLAASAQSFYNVSWKKAALTAVLMALAGLAVGVALFVAAMAYGQMGAAQ